MNEHKYLSCYQAPLLQLTIVVVKGENFLTKTFKSGSLPYLRFQDFLINFINFAVMFI